MRRDAAPRVESEADCTQGIGVSAVRAARQGRLEALVAKRGTVSIHAVGDAVRTDHQPLAGGQTKLRCHIARAVKGADRQSADTEAPRASRRFDDERKGMARLAQPAAARLAVEPTDDEAAAKFGADVERPRVE